MCMVVDDYLPHMGKVARKCPCLIGETDQVLRTLGQFRGEVAAGDQCGAFLVILISNAFDTLPFLYTTE